MNVDSMRIIIEKKQECIRQTTIRESKRAKKRPEMLWKRRKREKEMM